MGTNGPQELCGTAVVRSEDPDDHVAALELATKRLHDAALRQGVFIGEPTMHVEQATSTGHTFNVLLLVAPVLATGTDEKIDMLGTTLDDRGDTPAG